MVSNMFKIIFRNTFIFLAVLFLFAPVMVGASDWEPGPSGQIDNPLGTSSFSGLFAGIVNWVAGIVGILAVLMILIGGIQYMISAGDQEKIDSAKKTIYWALIGLVVVLIAEGLLRAVFQILGA